MATYTAIADVSETLVALLRDQFAARDDVFSMGGESVSLVAPDSRRGIRDTAFGVAVSDRRERLDEKY